MIKNTNEELTCIISTIMTKSLLYYPDLSTDMFVVCWLSASAENKLQPFITYIQPFIFRYDGIKKLTLFTYIFCFILNMKCGSCKKSFINTFINYFSLCMSNISTHLTSDKFEIYDGVDHAASIK